jgi:hypothetical protein
LQLHDKIEKRKDASTNPRVMPTWVAPQVQNPHFRKLSNLFLGFWCKKPKRPPITDPWIGVFKSYFEYFSSMFPNPEFESTQENTCKDETLKR